MSAHCRLCDSLIFDEDGQCYGTEVKGIWTCSECLSVIRAAVAEAVAEEREMYCCDMCFWCREARDEEYVTAAYPADGGWFHALDGEDFPVWCEADAIRARAAASAEEEA